MTPLSERFTRALTFATELHAEQVRKGSEVAYISHLMAVCALVIEHGGDEDEAIAALLHDAVEDQGGQETRRAILHRFGQRVAEIVDGCTDAVGHPKPPWRDRKERYIAHIATAEPSVLLVSAADKVHNARAILTDYRRLGEALWDRFRGGRQTLWYYRSLLDAYRRADPPTHVAELVEELGRVYDQIAQIAQIGEG